MAFELNVDRFSAQFGLDFINIGGQEGVSVLLFLAHSDTDITATFVHRNEWPRDGVSIDINLSIKSKDAKQTSRAKPTSLFINYIHTP